MKTQKKQSTSHSGTKNSPRLVKINKSISFVFYIVFRDAC